MVNRTGNTKKTTVHTTQNKEMTTKVDKNAFASPWNDSDMVLVVEDQELHVHKSILTLQSPVFKAMFDGYFQEANQNKITLPEKDSQSIIQFLKLLYPSSMFPESKAPLDTKGRLSVMALADEYQCESLMKQCIDEAKITTKNVLKILPYAVNYHPTALDRMFNVIKSGITTRQLEEFLPEIAGSKDITKNMLLTKCHFLESKIVDMQQNIVCLLRDFVIQKKFADDVKSELDEALKQIAILKRGDRRVRIFSAHNNWWVTPEVRLPLPYQRSANVFLNSLRQGVMIMYYCKNVHSKSLKCAK